MFCILFKLPIVRLLFEGGTYRPLAMTSSKIRVGHLGDNSHAQIYDGIADNTGMASKGAILQGYKVSLVDSRSRERYAEKLELINGKDPYTRMSCLSKRGKMMWTYGLASLTSMLECTWCSLQAHTLEKLL